MAIDLLNGLIDILWLIWCHVGADVVSVYLKAADLRQNIFIFTKPLTPKIPFSLNTVIESDGEMLIFEFFFIFIFYFFCMFKKKSGIELLRTHGWNVTRLLCAFALIYTMKSQKLLFLFLSPLKKTTNKNRRIFEITTQCWEYSDSPDPLCHFVGIKREEKSASTFSTCKFFEADSCFCLWNNTQYLIR